MMKWRAEMRNTILGRTGIATTAAGLGAGGFSRIGIEKYGEAHAAGVVRKAYELGLRFFDTATAYGTEAAVGEGLSGIPRSSYTVSTKFPLFGGDWRSDYAKRFSETLDASLRALKTDYVDIYHIHGVKPEEYGDVRELLVLEMQRARDAGKIRFLGVTERFMFDTDHRMLAAALEDDIFDVYMVGFNLLNPSAAKTVLPLAMEKNVGILNMFAVRHALADPAQLKKEIQKILDHGQGGLGLVLDERALDFLVASGEDGLPIAESIMDAAYRYCAHTEGIHVVLTGTGNTAHLEDNLRSLERAALPAAILDRLEQLFGAVDCVCGQDV
jgi:aryl-alcohol dehydrogenase-like predicted oxidoreductase